MQPQSERWYFYHPKHVARFRPSPFSPPLIPLLIVGSQPSWLPLVKVVQIVIWEANEHYKETFQQFAQLLCSEGNVCRVSLAPSHKMERSENGKPVMITEEAPGSSFLVEKNLRTVATVYRNG